MIPYISPYKTTTGTTVNFEGSTDGAEWQPIVGHQLGTTHQVSTTSTDGDYRINCAGLKNLRARISGYSAGTVTVKGYVSPLAGQPSTIGISGSADTAQTDATQTTSIGSFIKGLVKIFADVWDSANHVLFTALKLRTTGGWTPFKVISAASTNATSVKSSAGQLGGLQVFNNSANIGYLKLYDKASTPTVGTDTPIKTLLIPANTNGAGFTLARGVIGTQFSNGIALAITGGIADNDNTAVAASAFIVNGDYN